MKRWLSSANNGFVLALLFIAALERFCWAAIRPGNGATGEAANVAVTLASRGIFGDPFEAGQGPTAHLLPTMPALAGGVYAVLGVKSWASEATLTTISILLVLSSFTLNYLTFERIQSTQSSRNIALAVLSVFPVYFGQEAVDFRVWEGGITAVLYSTLLFMLTGDSAPKANSSIFLLAAVTAVLLFVNPPMGIAGLLAYATYVFRFYDFRSWLKAIALGTIILIALIAPWMMRNERELGHPIALRSNAGLELAIANHDAAVSTRDPLSTFQTRLRDIHPAQSKEAYANLVKHGGEVAYSQMLGEKTWAWIKSNPTDFMILSLRHWVEYYFPRPWQFRISGSSYFPEIRSAWTTTIGALALIGAMYGLLVLRGLWTYVSIMVILPGIIMMPFQPIPRYTYLVYPLAVFTAGHVSQQLYQNLAKRVQKIRYGST